LNILKVCAEINREYGEIHNQEDQEMVENLRDKPTGFHFGLTGNRMSHSFFWPVSKKIPTYFNWDVEAKEPLFFSGPGGTSFNFNFSCSK